MTAVAIVTGAAGSLGRSISTRLARELDALLLVDLPSATLDAAAAELAAASTTPVIAVGCDITTPDAPTLIAGKVNDFGWAVHVLVNNAGINRDARMVKMSEQQFRSVIAVDLIAPLRLAQTLKPAIARGGSVVNISSRAALGNFGQANYVAAKSGLVALTRALALRWAPDIRVNAIAPGLVDTPMTAGMPPEVLGKLVDRVPARRMAQPSEIADAVAFYASPAASYITGQLLLVCGGRSFAP